MFKSKLCFKEFSMKNMKHLFSVFSGFLAALLLAGCFNPISFNAASPPEAEAAGAEPFTVTLTINGDGSAAAAGGGSGRAVFGLEGGVIKGSGNGARNYMQLITARNGELQSFSEDRQTGNSPQANFSVNVTSGKIYDFLLLMGHWERKYGTYDYKAGPPTLLAAGLQSKEIQPGSNTVTITMYPIVIDTKFIAGGVVTETKGADGVFSLAPGKDWDLKWTATRGSAGTNSLDVLVAAQKKISGRENENTLLLKSASAVGSPQPGIGSLNGNVFTLNIGKYTLPQTGTEGYANFNLEYAPFGVNDPAAWEGFSGGGLPIWIIRNGVNNEAQTVQTDFTDPNKWGGGGVNGNGSERWKIAVKTPAEGSGLTVTNGSYTWPAKSQTGTVGFTAGGYLSGTAEGYYAVVGKDAGKPGYSAYTLLAAGLAAGAHTGKPITLPGKTGDYDVYVVIYKDGEVSSPLKINMKKNDGEVDIGYEWGDVSGGGSPGDNTSIDEKNLLTVLGVSTAAEAIENLHARLNNAPDGDGTPKLAGLKLGMYLDLTNGINNGATIAWNEGYKNLRIVIASFDQYKEAETTLGAKPNTKNHIKFVFKNIPVNKQMRIQASNAEGYPYDGNEAQLKHYLEGGFFNGLKAALGGKDYFYAVTRKITGGSYGGWTAVDFTAKIFIDTEKEVFGTNKNGHAESEGGLTQTALYARGGTAWRIKKYEGVEAPWWESSPYSGTAYYFCKVSADGSSDLDGISSIRGVVPAFCIY
jgi:hypothetical protein